MNADITARREWAASVLEHCPEPVPTYGSTLFNALNNADMRRVASVVRAAECWARDGDDLIKQLKLEVDLAAELHKADEDARYATDVAEHAERWGHLAVVHRRFLDAEESRGVAARAGGVG